MTMAHESSDMLTPLRPERVDILGFASELERYRASEEWVCSGSPGIEDVDGAARILDAEEDQPARVLVSDVPTVAWRVRRVDKTAAGK